MLHPPGYESITLWFGTIIMKIDWVLAESSRMRYSAGSSMYFAQGTPYSLMNIAVPPG